MSRNSGQYYDSETGLHYNYHRYYAQYLGRYLRPDPIGLNGGINHHIYALNNPVNKIDPFGLYTWPYTWKGWAGVVITGAGAVTVFIPGGLPVGIGLIATGGGFTLWDTVEGFNQAERDAKTVVRKLIQNKIEQAGGDAKWLQEMGLIPSTKKLIDVGFSYEELKNMGLIERNPPCAF